MNDALHMADLTTMLEDDQPVMPDYGDCAKCGEALECGPWGFIDCPACNPNPARDQ